jgi:hypothetical protein
VKVSVNTSQFERAQVMSSRLISPIRVLFDVLNPGKAGEQDKYLWSEIHLSCKRVSQELTVMKIDGDRGAVPCAVINASVGAMRLEVHIRRAITLGKITVVLGFVLHVLPPQLPVATKTCSARRRIASLLRSTSSEEVAQEDTLIRMARRPFQIVPPHQHVPSS